jgi:RNA-directed DNA polymerase
MSQSSIDVRKTQTSFARKAKAEPEHKFQDLWHLLTRNDWIRSALTKTLANDGSKTPGIDGVNKSSLKDEEKQAKFIESLKTELRNGSYRPTPVKRTWIPKPGKTEKRPLGIPMWRSLCTSHSRVGDCGYQVAKGKFLHN